MGTFRKKTLSLIAILLALFAFFASLPAIVSTTRWGKAVFLAIVNQSLPGTIHADRIVLSWLGCPHSEGVTFTHTDETMIFKADSITAKRPLIAMLQKGFLSSPFQLKSLDISIKRKRPANNHLAETCLQKDLRLHIETLTAHSLHPLLPTKKFSIKNVVFHEGKEAVIPTIDLCLDSRQKSENVLHIKGKTLVQGSKEGCFSGILKLRSSLPISAFSGSLVFSATRCPSQFFTLLTGRDELKTLIGSTANVEMDINSKRLHGHLKMHICGSKGSAVLDGVLKDGAIFLQSPLVVETKAQGCELGKINPLFNELVSYKGTLRLTVFPDHFYCPLLPFKLDQIQIGSAELSTGILQFRNKGAIKKILALLKPSRSDLIKIWMTPIYFSLKKGIVTVERMDMLVADQYPLAVWGTMDLVNDRLHMNLGLTGAALAQTLGIDSLNEHLIIPVSIKGSIDNITISQKTAAAVLSALGAKGKGATKAFPFGALLEFASGRGQKIPSPTTSPFPWEEQATKEPKRTQKKRRSDPLKVIKKEVKERLIPKKIKKLGF